MCACQVGGDDEVLWGILDIQYKLTSDCTHYVARVLGLRWQFSHTTHQ